MGNYGWYHIVERYLGMGVIRWVVASEYDQGAGGGEYG